MLVYEHAARLRPSEKLAGLFVCFAWTMLALPVTAKDGLQLDMATLQFNYTVTNPGAGEGEQIGVITVVDGNFSILDLLKVNLGGDQVFGGGNDTPIDVADIADAGRFDVRLTGQVIKLSGSNNYQLIGQFSATDTLTSLANPSVHGDFSSSSITLGGRVFSIIGQVSVAAGNDSILLPVGSSDWSFTGVASDTPPTPDEDGVRGKVTVFSGRELHISGSLVEFHFAFDGNTTLDAYFQQNRSASSADIKLLITPIDPPPVLGACCLTDGSCAQLTADECAARGGSYQGDNVSCDNRTCQFPGACCLPDGTCEVLYEDECAARSGTYQGDRTRCDQSTCARSGACCLTDGTCVEATRDQCDARGGQYLGDDTACDPNTCVRTGACCLPDGSCAEMKAVDCEAQGGLYKGDDTPCTPDICDRTGACCLTDGTCAVTTNDECNALGGQYQGDDSSCGPDACVRTGACCLSDGSCVEVTGDECDARGGQYRGDGTSCGPDTCARPGACCLSDGSCVEVTGDECDARGGQYRGDGTSCGPDTCARAGACCLRGDDDCNKSVCETGRPKTLTFLYTGADCANPENNNSQRGDFSCSDDYNRDPIPINPVRIRVTNKSDTFDRYAKVWFDGIVSVGSTFTADAARANQPRLYSSTYIAILDPNNPCKIYQRIHINTSCCKPLRLGDIFASVKLIAFTTDGGGSGSLDDCRGDTCEQLTRNDCLARGGDYKGDNTTCTDDICVRPCVIICPPDVTVCRDYGCCYATNVDLGRPSVEGDCDGVVITNNAPSKFPVGITRVTWVARVGDRQTTCEQVVTVLGTISGRKFYDKDLDGVRDSNEPGINGWRIELRDASGQTLLQKTYTRTINCEDGRYRFCVPPGTYTVVEVAPNDQWLATTPMSYVVTLDNGECGETRHFGNVCLGGGGGHTPGFWSNKNGESKMKDGGSDGPELQMLCGLNLRDGNGNNFNPSSYSQFRTWILGANATNMAYMLSAHLAAMALNVEAGYVSSSSVVYAPGIGNCGPGNNFITIGDLMAAADRATGNGLGADGYTPSGDPNRAIQEKRKDAMDRANNNENFVQSQPCCFQSPY